MNKVLIAAAGALASLGLHAATYYPITIGYEPTTTLSDFPVLVRIPSGSPIYTSAGTGGANLRFTDDLGVNNYPHEVDTWNPAGESLVWVKIPELKAGASFRLYCSGDDTTLVKDLWSAYAGVWHLNEALDSADKDYNPEDGTTHTTAILGDEVASAVIGKGYGRAEMDKGPTLISQVYDNRNGYKCPIQITNPAQFTVSCWVNIATPSPWKLFYGAISAVNGNTGWCATFGNPKDTTKTDISVRQYGGQGDQLIGFSNLPISGWTKVDVIYDYTSLALYTNGVLIAKNSVPAQKNPVWYWTGWLGWGGCVGSDGSAVASGASATQFDECRLYDGVKSADRIMADYQTVVNPVFLTIGEEQEEQTIPEGSVAQVGTDYYQDITNAVNAAKELDSPVILLANGLSWTFITEGESLKVKLGSCSFSAENGRGEEYYIESVYDSTTEVTTYTLKKQVVVTAMRNVAVYKELYTRDLASLLPAQVAGLDADGKVVGMFDVVWDVEPITKYDCFGITTVPGVATVGGERWPVTAFVRAALSYSDDYHNIAQEATSMVVTAPAKDEYEAIDDVSQISEQNTSLLTNGLPATAVSGSWMTDTTGDFCNWKSNTKNPFVDVALSWGETKRIYRIDVIARGGGNNDRPKSLVISADGKTIADYLPTENANTRPKLNFSYS